MLAYLREIWRFRHIPMTQTAVDLKRGVRDMRLGPIWWILDPLLMMAVYYFLVVVIFHRGGPNYPVFLLAGLIPWQWFSGSLTACTASVKRNKGLVLQLKVPLFSLQLGTLFVNFVYMLLGLVVVLVFAGRIPGLELIYLIPLFVAEGLFTLGLGSILAIINVFVPDTQRFLPSVIRAWWYLSPVLYSGDRLLHSTHIPELAKQAYASNPFVTFMPAYREILLNGTIPNLTAVGVWIAVSAGMVFAGLLMLKNIQGRVVKFV